MLGAPRSGKTLFRELLADAGAATLSSTALVAAEDHHTTADKRAQSGGSSSSDSTHDTGGSSSSDSAEAPPALDEGGHPLMGGVADERGTFAEAPPKPADPENNTAASAKDLFVELSEDCTGGEKLHEYVPTAGFYNKNCFLGKHEVEVML